jgi:hypothetical protein
MNDPENRIPDGSELAELKHQVGDIRRLVVTLLLGLFAVSGTFTGLMWVQSRRVGRQLDQVRPQAIQVIDASLKEGPQISMFLSKLVDYSRTHPDFKPILMKYRLGTNAAAYTSNMGPMSLSSNTTPVVPAAKK